MHILMAIALTGPLLGCGQKGDLYLAKDDPERAERDARGRGEPFPFPPEDADWPPAGPADDAGDSAAAAR
jgi:predicted small lipoprotein YifL